MRSDKSLRISIIQVGVKDPREGRTWSSHVHRSVIDLLNVQPSSQRLSTLLFPTHWRANLLESSPVHLGQFEPGYTERGTGLEGVTRRGAFKKDEAVGMTAIEIRVDPSGEIFGVFRTEN